MRASTPLRLTRPSSLAFFHSLPWFRQPWSFVLSLLCAPLFLSLKGRRGEGHSQTATHSWRGVSLCTCQLPSGQGLTLSSHCVYMSPFTAISVSKSMQYQLGVFTELLFSSKCLSRIQFLSNSLQVTVLWQQLFRFTLDLDHLSNCLIIS